MKTLLTLLFLAASAYAQTATITDTIATPFAGTFSGTVTVTLNSPALAQPLYSGNVTLSGWTQTVTVTSGAFTLTLYTNDLITPGGTSYTATYAPTSGSGWKETWIVPTGATTIREIRSTTVPSPSVRFTPSQITQAGATLGQGLRWNGSIWAPATFVADPMTTTGDLITRSGGVPVRVGIGSTGQVLTVSAGMPVWAAPATNGTVTSVSVATANGVSGTVANPSTTPAITLSLGAITPSSVAATGTVTGSNLSGTNTGDQTSVTGNAGTATALAANGANCSAGSFPLGVDASGNAESCTAAVTASTGLSDSAGIVRGGAALSTTGSVPFVTSAGVLGQSANLFWSSANNRLGINTNTPAAALDVAGDVFIRTGNRITADTFDNYTGGSTAMTVRTGGNQALVFGTNNTERARFVGSTGNLLLGTTTDDGTNRLQVAGSMAGTVTSAVSVQDGATSLRLGTSLTGTAVPGTAGARLTFAQRWSSGDVGIIRVGAINGWKTAADGAFGGGIQLLHQPNSATDMVPTLSTFMTGNIAIGITTDGNFKLDVADSGSSGGLRVWDQRATIGSTSLVVRAGAGQGSNAITTWQDSSGVFQSRIQSSGGFQSKAAMTVIDSGATVNHIGMFTTGLALASNVSVSFSSTTEATATKDLSLSRASANTLQVGDGSANSNGTILARIYTWSNGTEGTCDATLRGQVVMVQGGAGVADTFRICRKDAADAYAWTALY